MIFQEPMTSFSPVLRLMKELQADLGMAILYISHDLGVIARMADDVAVMYLGTIVERAPVPRLTQIAPDHRAACFLYPQVVQVAAEAEARHAR